MESGEIWNNLKGFEELLGLIAMALESWLLQRGVAYLKCLSFLLYKRKPFLSLKTVQIATDLQLSLHPETGSLSEYPRVSL